MASELVARAIKTWQQIKNNLIEGSVPAYVNFNSHPLVGTGVSVFFNDEVATSANTDVRNNIVMSPDATVPDKEKAVFNAKER